VSRTTWTRSSALISSTAPTISSDPARSRRRRARARLEFGGHQRFKEECREAVGIAFIDTLAQDLRFSVRLLRKSPAFTSTAAATLALGIGATTVVFSVLNAFILRPLDVPDADSLYQIERGPGKAGSQSYPDYLDLRDRNRTFADLAAFSFAQVGFDTGDNPTRAWAESVTRNYFDAVRIRPHLGRFFHAADEHGPNSVPAIVLGTATGMRIFRTIRRSSAASFD
jgi:hypothetical protein